MGSTTRRSSSVTCPTCSTSTRATPPTGTRFGIPRSHGCINLAPIDAMRVFRFTAPPVLEGWHGIQIEPNKGTVVIVHP
ncbi:MAG: L,D-transpeptidase [Myxococcales bacterium]|nr:L,D-transpeptidase [Myxococcales bacterium]